MKDKKTKKYSFDCPVDMTERLELISKKTGLSRSAIFLKSLDNLLSIEQEKLDKYTVDYLLKK